MSQALHLLAAPPVWPYNRELATLIEILNYRLDHAVSRGRTLQCGAGSCTLFGFVTRLEQLVEVERLVDTNVLPSVIVQVGDPSLVSEGPFPYGLENPLLTTLPIIAERLRKIGEEEFLPILLRFVVELGPLDSTILRLESLRKLEYNVFSWFLQVDHEVDTHLAFELFYVENDEERNERLEYERLKNKYG